MNNIKHDIVTFFNELWMTNGHDKKRHNIMNDSFPQKTDGLLKAATTLYYYVPRYTAPLRMTWEHTHCRPAKTYIASSSSPTIHTATP